MRIFGDPTRMKALMTRVGMKAGEAIESGMLTRQIERAQRRVEQHNFDARSNCWNTTTWPMTSARSSINSAPTS